MPDMLELLAAGTITRLQSPVVKTLSETDSYDEGTIDPPTTAGTLEIEPEATTPNSVDGLPLFIDVYNHRVTCGERTAELSGQELRLLLCFQANIGRLLPVSYLAAHMRIRSGDYVGLLYVYLSRLRIKLGSLGFSIRNKRNIGYVCDVPMLLLDSSGPRPPSVSSKMVTKFPGKKTAVAQAPEDEWDEWGAVEHMM